MTGNYPDGMTRSDWIHVGEIEPDYQGETKVLRAVVYITYEQEEIQFPEEDIEECQSPYDAEKDIQRVLARTASAWTISGAHLRHRADKVEVVDAQYMTEAEADLASSPC